MKVCKKCKTHVANKAKICKKCGADVSKAKIIKTGNSNNKNITKVNASKTKVNTDIKESKKTTITVEKDIKEPIEITSPDNKNFIIKIKNSFKKIDFKNNKLDYIRIFKNVKGCFVKAIAFIYYWLKKFTIFIWIGLLFLFKELFCGIKTTILLTIENFKNMFILLYKGLKILFKLIVKLFKSIKRITVKYLSVTLIFVKKVSARVSSAISKGVKNGTGHIKNSFSNRRVKRQDIKQKRLQRQEERYVKKQEKLKRKAELQLEKEKAIEDARRLIELEEKEKNVEVKIIKKGSKHKKLKISIACLIVLSILGAGYVYGKELYEDLTGKPAVVVVSKKATKDKVFDMGDIVSYNGIDYKIVKIETSNGNAYKSPKYGNQFLIVTIYIKNTLKEKVSYSYQNWTMSNSKGEEKKRIFTSINVDTALYSGELVRGGIKTGSMVFEQPIDDSKLKMNFYDLKKDEEGNDVIDEAKRVFSISVKVPDYKKDSSSKDESKDSKDVSN